MPSLSLDISSSALSPQTWPFSQEWLPPQACLVGGAVRDALLGRRAEYLDLDFVLPVDAVQTARKLAQQYKAGFVVLDAQRQIARVVFDKATVDLAQQEGDSLETDLHRRDFTINAIAYNPHTNEFINPIQGIEDCQNGIIRMVSANNLQDDPLRLLRAYRQAAQLGFKIESATHATIRQLAPLLGQVAAERVQVELGYLLKSPQGTPWLTAAWGDNLLKDWFPNAEAQGLAQLPAIDQSAVLLAETWSQLGMELRASVGGKSASLLSLAKLSRLLPSMPEVAQEHLLRLKYSRAEVRAVLTIIKYLPQLLSHSTTPMPIREQYFFFQNVGTLFPALAVLAVAPELSVDALSNDTAAPLEQSVPSTRLQTRNNQEQPELSLGEYGSSMLILQTLLAPLINCYINPDDQVAHPTPLITGKDLMQSLQIQAGTQVGQLLSEIQIARAEGRISTSAEALKLAAQLVNNEQ